MLSDAVVIWRAWAICQRSTRKYLWVTMGSFILTASTCTFDPKIDIPPIYIPVAVFATIGFRTVAFIQFPNNNLNKSIYLTPGLDILQLSSWTLSLLSNLSATVLVALTAWCVKSLSYRDRSNSESHLSSAQATSANCFHGKGYYV